MMRCVALLFVACALLVARGEEAEVARLTDTADAVEAVEALAAAAEASSRILGEDAKTTPPTTVVDQAKAKVKELCTAATSRLEGLKPKGTPATAAAGNNRGVTGAVKLWEGSLNSTHQSASPASDGLAISSTHQAKWVCASQTNATNSYGKNVKNGYTCTSCKKGNTYIPQYHKAKTGKCVKNGKAIKINCITLDKNDNAAMPTTKDKLCTKYGVVETAIPVNQGWVDAATETATRGLNGHAVAFCNLWKQTVCRGGACTAKKEVTCAKVCKLKGWLRAKNQTEGLYEVEGCSEAECKKKTGPLFCKRAVMME